MSAAIPTADDPKSYMEYWRETKGTEFDGAKWGRLELDLGRWAQVAGIAGGVILGLVVLIVSWAPPDNPIVENFRRTHMTIWFPLIATSISLSAFTVMKKLGPFRQGLASAHFVSSAVALGTSLAVLALVLLDQAYLIDLGWFQLWMYPASVLGLSLTFVSLAITWEGFGLRKDASIITAAAVPILLTIIPLTNSDPDVVFGPALSLLFVYTAIFTMLSGSMIHLTASAADPSQREILKGSDQKISQLRHEYEEKLNALDYKEGAYSQLDADIASRRKELVDYEVELEARAKELNAVQAKMDQQRAAMQDGESRYAKTQADVDSKLEASNLREKELATVRAELEESRKRVEQRDGSTGDREKELKRLQIDLSSRERTVKSRASELATLEARLKKEGDEVDARRNDAIRREKDLQLKGSEARMIDPGQSKDLKDKMAQLLARERELAKVEVNARQMSEEAKQRMAEADEYAEALKGEKRGLTQREEELNSLEKGLSDSDSSTTKKASELERRLREVSDLQRRLQTREGDYNSLFKDAKLREAEASGTQGEMARKLAAIETREQQLAKWRRELETETKNFNQTLRDVAAREKALERKESKFSLRELEMGKMDRDTIRVRATPGLAEADSDKVFDLREKRLREKEEEFQRRTYQKEKEMEAREMGVREQLKNMAPGASASEDSVEVSVSREGRLRTGTPRLDDLLYGGFPMNANILFVGPAFVGKEVAVLNFIAEGLRTNVPAIIVTTSKPPIEIAKDMAPVLPTFLEYEQLGLVRWIDASGQTPTKKLVRDGKTFRVPNAADFDGILSAVNSAEEEFREESAPYYRLAFLSLSSSLSQSDEKSYLGFVQRFVNRLRQGKCIATFALERGMHTDQQLESLQQLMDGALHFKQDKAKTIMSVVGIGEVQTRDWVPYKFTNKSIMIGSFQLERIR